MPQLFAQTPQRLQFAVLLLLLHAALTGVSARSRLSMKAVPMDNTVSAGPSSLASRA